MLIFNNLNTKKITALNFRTFTQLELSKWRLLFSNLIFEIEKQ
jgi:hypothetical protein